jgi:hypothetical protein
MTRMQTDAIDTSTRIDFSRGDEKHSLGRAIRASITGDWERAGFERACSRELEKRTGMTASGFFVPSHAWRRDFNVGTASEAGNLVATDLRSDLFVDALRNALILAQLGVRVLPSLTGNIDIPRKSTAGTLGMLTEIGSASETAPVTAKISLTPKRIGAYVEYSSTGQARSARAMLRDDLIPAAACSSQMLNGTGTGAEMRGTRTPPALARLGAPMTSPRGRISSTESACGCNAAPDALAGCLNSAVARSRRPARDELGLHNRRRRAASIGGVWRVNGYRAAVSNALPANLTKGTSTTICSSALFASDFSMGVLALFGAPDITVDPYTLAATGQVRITLNQFADFGVRQPDAFAKIDDLLS